jgi:hypothetical protein
METDNVRPSDEYITDEAGMRPPLEFVIRMVPVPAWTASDRVTEI